MEKLFLSWGIVFGIVALPFSVIGAFGILLLFAMLGLVRRTREPPVIGFCLAYQWVFANLGFWDYLLTGTYPDANRVGDLEAAVLLSNLGLFTIALAIRFTYRWLPAERNRNSGWLESVDTTKMLRIIAIVYSINWMQVISPMLIWYAGAQVIYNLLLYRDGLLMLFLWCCCRQGKLGTACLGFAIASIPSLFSQNAKFAQYLFILLIAVLADWSPFADAVHSQLRSRKALIRATVVMSFIVSFAILWLGGVKQRWRALVTSNDVSTSTFGRLVQFRETVGLASKEFSLDKTIDAMSRRFSSDLLYFSYVLERVPDQLPHEQGRLLAGTFGHIVIPRFLFPNKRALAASSWMVRKYAGVMAADERQATSVGFGYICETYIDWGVPFLFVELFAWGILIGISVIVLRLISPSQILAISIFVAIAIQHLCGYGSDVTKMLGGFLQSMILAVLAFQFFRRQIHRLAFDWLPRAAGTKRNRNPAIVAPG